MSASPAARNVDPPRLAPVAASQLANLAASTVTGQTTVDPMRAKIIAALASPSGGAPPAAQSAPPSEAIARFVELEIEARQCDDLETLRFAVVNSTRKLAAFDLSFLIEPVVTGGWTMSRASSVSKLDVNAPLPRAIALWLAHPDHANLLQRGEARRANLDQEAADWGLQTQPFAHPHAIWLPLKARDGRNLAALLALKKDIWLPQDIALLLPLAGAYGHAWEALLPKRADRLARAGTYVSKAKLALTLGVAAVLAAFVPLPISVLAPSEVVAAEPGLVTAPIDGVIGNILAAPGTWVEKDTVIVQFVDVKLRNDLEVASRNADVAKARYFNVVQAATANQKDMEDLATSKAEFDVANAELQYASALLSRSEIRASKAGLLIYSAKSDWLGKPVVTGERLMEIGDPDNAEIKIELPVSDAIALEAGGHVSLFLDGDPMTAVSGTISRINYRPAPAPGQQLVYRVYSKFDQGQVQRIGTRGIARVSGGQVPLWFYLLRRPMAAVRQWIGR